MVFQSFLHHELFSLNDEEELLLAISHMAESVPSLERIFTGVLTRLFFIKRLI